ncbi:Per os infectivity factor 5 [Perigonia lusca single nucleopolyhedrovirus]|uniref:Per os infectivity factor 5 n=1 Tax=Perigonia lusca single nucleopolyhedrovirus TaxID=1675865 RepID=A0A0M3WNL2_9ABAC|nr:Per os infectivity factor 5 [Perigonia lusca single nucleopolyhedrovirus]AKN80622.1 Per os infectivity factor 5 [Perigonia lusca single nucleopolyhedrovirus]
MTFFTSLRRVNKVYTNPTQFTNIDNVILIRSAPNGFQDVFNAPTALNLGNNTYRPGYRLDNNVFVLSSDINRVMRNNDISGIRSIFRSANNSQINSVSLLRRADNVPDARFHSSKLKRDAVRANFPNTATRTPDGVLQVLETNPRLNNRLISLKSIGTPILLGVGIYLVFSAATLIQDIINVINTVGGSYYVTGLNGGDTVNSCLLRHRTCQLPVNIDSANLCTFDPLLIDDTQALNSICQGFDYNEEKTVCRASDPNADPLSPQYVDISDLPVDHMLTCIEPYDFADLIGDLGLDNLLGEDGLVSKSSDKSSSISDKLLPLILMIGAIILIAIVLFFIIKALINRQKVVVSSST